jgi:hypothetical protein
MKNISKIYLLGDSWIEGQGCGPEPDLGDSAKAHKEVREWRRETAWNKHFREKYNILDYQIVNLGSQGSDNYGMFYQLNKILKNYKDNELILFGFTSKYRDSNTSVNMAYSNLFPMNNIINQPITFEKLQFSLENPQMFLNENPNTKHLEFQQEFIRDFLSSVFDERTHENLAQQNYLFYQNWCKYHNVNILFFDLFESYINSYYVSELFDVDQEMYFTYNEKTCFDKLVDYELENYNPSHESTVWEENHMFPCEFRYKNGGKSREKELVNRNPKAIWHPNQYGYEYLFNYITSKVDKTYKIVNSKTII